MKLLYSKYTFIKIYSPAAHSRHSTK